MATKTKKEFTIKDLKEIKLDAPIDPKTKKPKKGAKGEVRFAFPNSPQTYNKLDAENILIIANYIGILTDGLRSEILVNLIADVKAIKAELGLK